MAELRFTIDRETVSANLERIGEEIAAACRISGRSAQEVEILAATKYVDCDQLGLLADAGVTLVGENRAQPLVEKQRQWQEQFTWDFIGRLQSRKVREILGRVRLIHSLASRSALDQIVKRSRQPVAVLLEVNLSGEQSKSGVAPGHLSDFVETATLSDLVQVEGLMTMPPFSSDPQSGRRYFSQLRDLAAELRTNWEPRYSFETLSMGTSQDYITAVEEGATVIRLGSALYS